MRNQCIQAPFALFLSIKETESKPFTFQTFAIVPKLTGQLIKLQEQYNTLTYTYIWNTSWKVRAYGVYTRVVAYLKSNK